MTKDSRGASPPNVQIATVSGSGIIVVQAMGDGITIDVNRPYLTLNARHRFARAPGKYLDLLNPINRAIPMVGRETEMRDLQAWLGSGVPISVRCLIGGAGSGKTRLALELCAQTDQHRWLAGFVGHGELIRFHSKQNLASWEWPRATLIVVDYAAAKAQVLREWLAELVQRPGGAKEPPLRLLLLERHAEARLGWWSELTTPRGWAEERLRELFDPIEPIPLPNIRNIEDRREILDTVMVAASKVAGKPEPLRPPPKGSDPAFDHRLANPALEFAPLHLMMAGVLGVEHGAPQLLALGPTVMAQELANFELGRIETLAKDRGLDFHFLRYLAAGITLAGGLAPDDLTKAIAVESQVMGFSDPTPTVEHALHDALPGERADWVGAILPDLIGEAAVVKVIGELAAKQRLGAVKRWYQLSPIAVMSALIRTIQDYATQDDHPALKWFDDIVAGASDVNGLMSIANQLPGQTVVLRERAAGVEAVIAQSLRTPGAGSASQERQAALATSLSNLASRLSDLGKREAALASAQEGVDIRRELAAARPDAFRPDLATSLNILTIMLSELGRREAALASAQEGVDIRRELAAARPDVFRPGLAMSLTNLATTLSDLGRREQALATAQEAAALYGEVAAARLDAFRPDLATSLNNLANRLSELGRREQALTTAQEALAIRRELAAARPDAFRPDLAMSLNNLGNMLSDLGRREEALAAAQEAAEVYRELAAARRDAFHPYLAGSLSNLANRLSDLGRREETLAAAQEAVELYRELAAARPDAFRPYLATSLSVMADCLEGAERLEEANRADTEAVAALSPYYIAEPRAFAGSLTPIVRDYFHRCEKLGREPDVELLGPILAAFKKLRDSD